MKIRGISSGPQTSIVWSGKRWRHEFYGPLWKFVVCALLRHRWLEDAAGSLALAICTRCGCRRVDFGDDEPEAITDKGES